MTATDDGALVVGARCTEEGCEWGPLGAADPDRWRLVERHRLSHKEDTGHTTTVEMIRQRTILDGTPGPNGLILDLAAEQSVVIEWVCPALLKMDDGAGIESVLRRVVKAISGLTLLPMSLLRNVANSRQ